MKSQWPGAVSALLFIALSLGFAYAVGIGAASITNDAMLAGARTLEEHS